MQITRELRFFLRPGGGREQCHNSWSGWNSAIGIAPYLELRLTVSGPVSASTGYLCDIRELDQALRSAVQDAADFGDHSAALRYDGLLGRVFEGLAGNLPNQIRPVRLELAVSPQISLTVSIGYPQMILWTQQSEFSAAHRLHCAGLSDEDNQNLFGKCNNPAGHGHNYVVEITLRCPTRNGQIDSLVPERVEQTVNQLVIQRLDHKNLNVDVAEFQSLNPSVENIALTIWGWLEGEFEPARLHNVRVYETPKTWADCPGPDAEFARDHS